MSGFVMPITERSRQQCEKTVNRKQPNKRGGVSGCKRQDRNGGEAMIKAFYAVVVSAIAAGCFVALPSLSEQVHATPPVSPIASEHVAVATIVATCGQNAWPYLEAACLRTQGPAIQPREVRLIAADRFGSAPSR
jgi:hypothetical protein